MGLLDRVNAQEASPGRRGLLNKALSNDDKDNTLDTNMGSVLVERLQRLQKNESSPFTALSLLKAFIPFHTGLILIQKGATYQIPAALGIEDTEEVNSTLIAQKLSSTPRLQIFENDELSSAPVYASKKIFLYPLFTNEHKKAVLLLGEGTNTEIDSDLLLHVLEETKEIFYGSFLQDKQELPTTIKIKDKKLSLLAENAAKNGFPATVLLLDFFPETDQDVEMMQKTLEAQGSTLLLPSNQFICISSSISDTELYLHRLHKSYGAELKESRLLENQEELIDYLASLK